MHRPSLPALTGIRFFAAFYVVLFHALPWMSRHFALPEFLRIFLSNGYLAVALFFLLSGFILAYTYEGQVGTLPECLKFWEARFARIYPVYFLSLMLALPFHPSLSRGEMASALTMVRAWNPLHPEWTGVWNYPAWSLSVEGFFYLCFPFLQNRISRLNDRALDLVTAAACIVSVLAHTPVQGLGSRPSFSLAGIFLPLPLIRLPEFVGGVGLGNRFLRRGVTGQNAFQSFAAAIGVFLLLSLPIANSVSLVIVPFGLLVYLLADRRNPFHSLLSSGTMLLLGGASYSVYLLQAPFRDWVRTLCTHAPRSIARVATPLVPALLVLFSVLVFKAWEEPMRRPIRFAFRSWQLHSMELPLTNKRTQRTETSPAKP